MKAGLKRWFACLAIGVTACAMLGSPKAAEAQKADPGALRYETYCTGCHGSVVHLRERRARTFDEIVREVARWQSSLGLKWTSEEINEVALHLDRRFYKLPRAVSERSGADRQP
jgi:hypothetical protein